MATKKKSKKSNWLTWLKSHKKITFFIFLVVIFVGYFITQKVLIYQEKKRYEIAERLIDEVIQGIYKEAGPADVTSSDKSCGHASRKFGKGPLGCTFKHVLVYPVKDNTDAENLVKKIDASLINSGKLKRKHPENKTSLLFSSNIEKRIDDSNQVGYSYLLILFHKPDCNIDYSFFNYEDDNIKIKTSKSNKNLSVIIDCGGEAKSAYYNLTD